MNSARLQFISVVGRCIIQVSNDSHKSAFLYQRLSVLIQRFNSVAIRGTFAHTQTQEDSTFFIVYNLPFNIRDLYYRG